MPTAVNRAHGQHTALGVEDAFTCIVHSDTLCDNKLKCRSLPSEVRDHTSMLLSYRADTR